MDKKIYKGYCSYTYSTIFLDQDYNYITDIHENDGNWRDEYYNSVLNYFDVEVEDINMDLLLSEYSDRLENYDINLDEIDFKELKNG